MCVHVRVCVFHFQTVCTELHESVLSEPSMAMIGSSGLGPAMLTLRILASSATDLFQSSQQPWEAENSAFDIKREQLRSEGLGATGRQASQRFQCHLLRGWNLAVLRMVCETCLRVRDGESIHSFPTGYFFSSLF